MKNVSNKGLSGKNNTQIGTKGESLALDFLLHRGYSLVHSNYRKGKAEIDIVLQKDTLLVFVEVKYRTSVAFGYPEAFVDKAKQKRIMIAAGDYVLEKNWQGDIRFDIVAIVDSKGEVQIEHFEDCF